MAIKVFVAHAKATTAPSNITRVVSKPLTSGYASWFMAGGAICITHYDVIGDVITRKL